MKLLCRQRADIEFNECKELIYTTTHGAFNLLKVEDFKEISSEGRLLNEIQIIKPEDVGSARQKTKLLLIEECFLKEDLMHIILCISEAATNIIKHAHDGVMQIRKLGDGLRFIFLDKGTGMEYKLLPNMILLKGYSTKTSMGYGFSIIYRFADKIYLATSDKGTLLALDFRKITP